MPGPFPYREFWQAELPSSISLAIGVLGGISNLNHLATSKHQKCPLSQSWRAAAEPAGRRNIGFGPS